MSPVAPGDYLEDVRNHLHLGKLTETEIISELKAHIEDEVQELKDKGLSEEEAIKTCLELLGSGKKVARQLYEAHSRGSWTQTLLAATPHLLVALMFALSWWPGIGWVLAVLTAVFGLAIYGWWKEKPDWIFSWLSYSLLPVIAVGLLMFYLPREWTWIALLVYIPLGSLLIYHITIQTIKRDWLYCSLMLLPVPITLAWLIIIGSAGEPNNISIEYLRYFSPWIGLCFLILAVSVALFIRARARWMKIASLIVAGLLTLALCAYYAQGRLNAHAFAILVLLIPGLFIAPALLEHKVKNRENL